MHPYQRLTTTLRYNYRCWMCYQKAFKGEMDWHIVEQLKPTLHFVKTLQRFGGAPLVYSRLQYLCRLTGDAWCERELITNGALLDEHRRCLLLDNNGGLVKISAGAATQKTYESIRGGDLHGVFDNISHLAAERKNRRNSNLKIQVNFVAMRRNITELADMIRMTADAGVERVLLI